MSKNCFFADFVIKTLFCVVSPRNSWKFAHFLRLRAFFAFTPEFVKIRTYFEMKTFFFGTHSRIRTIKVFVSPPKKILFMPPPPPPPSHAILAPGLICRSQSVFLRYSPKMLAISRTNDLLAIWSQTTV